ncbi:glycosyl transferase [Fulvitalea axinellae]|uniref:Glycosyl transferase n=1 Tax=Fulvitalea axinellae TaxID=1182444 RepID=A0AAU9D340_9BACT|nr:glycosyl transferase [Fulvitalea axinellae]
MRITFLNTFAESGGAAIAGNRLYDALATRDHHLSGLVQFSEKTARPYKSSGLGMFRLGLEKLFFLPYEKDKSVRYKFSTATVGSRIWDRLEVREADVLHLHWINQGFVSLQGLQYLARLGKPIIWTMHDMWPFTGGCHHSQECLNYQQACGNCKYLKKPAPEDLSHQIWKKKKEVYDSGNFHFVGVSQWITDLASESSLLSERSLTNIPNAIDTELFAPAGDKASAKRLFGLAPEKVVLAFSAFNLDDPRKGFSILKDALGKLLSENPELIDKLTLLVCGKTESEEKLFADIICEVSYKGLLRGEDKMREFYQASDLYVTPSLDENFGCTIMEALSCGLPVVAFPTGGTPELVKNGRNGALAEYGNATDLALRLKELLTDKSKTEALASNARAGIVSSYSYPVIANKYEELYAKALGR